ncbi:MAG: type II toxin-antitoxin system VapC family toxin [Spirochaetales bacterium]|nr:type II toxin-antitoxin system VapC family toxin [Spirochaetales bacterium]
MIYVLDTTAFSAAMRNEPEIVTFLEKNNPGNIKIVPPVVAEIEYGIARFPSSTKKYLLLATQKERLMKLIKVLPWIPESSVCFGKIKAELESSGRLIDDFDIAIAAIAMSHSASVITANLSHFKRIAELSCKHWID